MMLSIPRQRAFVRITALLLILVLTMPMVDPLSQDAEACLAAEAICLTLKNLADDYCALTETSWWECSLARSAAEVGCMYAKAYLCGSS